MECCKAPLARLYQSVRHIQFKSKSSAVVSATQSSTTRHATGAHSVAWGHRCGGIGFETRLLIATGDPGTAPDGRIYTGELRTRVAHSYDSTTLERRS